MPRENLLVYRGQDGARKPVATIDDWLQRRKEILAGMQVVMGRLPGSEKRCPLDVKVEEEVDCGSYVRRSITYSSEPGSRVPAYLLIPKEVLRGEGEASPRGPLPARRPITWSATVSSSGWDRGRTERMPASLPNVAT